MYTRHADELKAKAKTHTLEQVKNNLWKLTSGHSGNEYWIFQNSHDTFTCSCDWQTWHPGGECSHVIAVRKLIARQNGELVSAFDSMETAKRQHHKIVDFNDGLIFTTRGS